MRIALISCSAQKKNYACPASELYSASDLFSLSYEYAKKRADKIYILSALYGLVHEDRIIAPYNKNLNDLSRSEQLKWAESVLSDLKDECDLENDRFIFLAGKTYGQDIIPSLKYVDQPLKGLTIGARKSRLKELISNSAADMCFRLHKLLSGLPRYDWERIEEVPFENGIYIVFEKGEKYRGMDRVVRVGTHVSDGRLKLRLSDHFIIEDHDRSIFRKNIGKAILNAYHDPYLKNWSVDTSKPENHCYIDEAKNAETEARVSRFLRENFTFAVIPVETKERRLYLEEAIIAALSQSSDYKPSAKWSGRYSPEEEIRSSGLWLKQGLYGNPMSEGEYEELLTYCEASAEEASYKLLVNEFSANPRDVHTVPLGKRTPLWFYVYSENGGLFVSKALSHSPPSRMKSPRRLNEDEFESLLVLYRQRKNGQPVSVEATSATHNQVYWYGVFSEMGM